MNRYQARLAKLRSSYGENTFVQIHIVGSYLFTALNPNKIGHFNKGLDKRPRFV